MARFNRSEIFKRAWGLVKKAGLSISEALKKAWREAKMTKEEKIDKLIAAGAKRWQKGDMDRLYINAEIIGLSYDCNGQNGTFADKTISNSKVRDLRNEKHYIDCTDMSLHTNTNYSFVREALNSFIATALN